MVRTRLDSYVYRIQKTPDVVDTETETVFFASDLEFDATVALPLLDWEELGSPEEITVIVEPTKRENPVPETAP